MESILVQLFSNPQHTQAHNTNIEPLENCKLLTSSNDKRTLAIVTRIIPVHSFGDISSLNTNNAIKLVTTISKLFNNATFAELVNINPVIKKIGAATSRKTIAITNGISFLDKAFSPCSRLSFFLDFSKIDFTKPTTTSPIPAPKYKKDAIIVGGFFSNKSFETGVLSAYRVAAKSANKLLLDL